MSGSKRAFGVRGFEEYEDNDYICAVHGYKDRDGKHDNSYKIIVDGKEAKVCPTCFGTVLNKINANTRYAEFKKEGDTFIPIK